MVSSRWVLGSSKGIREFSTSRTRNQLSKTRASEAPAVVQCGPSDVPSIFARVSEPDSLANTSRPRKKAGPAGEQSLGFRNHSQKQRRQAERQQDVDRMMNDRFHHVLLLPPEQEGYQSEEDVQQVRLNASLLKDTEPRHEPGPKAKRRQHS